MRFRPILRPLLCKPMIDRLLRARDHEEVVKISLDLGRSLHECSIRGEGVMIDDQLIRWEELERASKRERDIFMVADGRLLSLSISGRHFYKLVFIGWGHPPTLEIDGIHMHRIKDITPDRDAWMKVKLCGDLRCKRVLDTCMGLGYTAIAALKMGACRIITVEVDENVVELARLNPWSKELSDERIDFRLGDIRELIDGFRGEFDAIVHDPPRFSLAGELYSLEFYRKLNKALRLGGRLVHYVGQPGIVKGRAIWRGVMRRLREAGFDVRYDSRSRCVYGVKLRDLSP